jgi:hypothetical protein
MGKSVDGAASLSKIDESQIIKITINHIGNPSQSVGQIELSTD